jgi:hypothetical protein
MLIDQKAFVEKFLKFHLSKEYRLLVILVLEWAQRFDGLDQLVLPFFVSVW